MTARFPAARILFGALGAAAAATFAWEVTHVWFSTTDTSALLFGTGAADRCLHAGIWSHCNSAGFGNVSHFALLQYLAALTVKRLGADIEQAYKWLCWMNAGAFLAVLSLMWATGRRMGGRPVGALMLLAGIASPLLWYSHSGFGEPLAALGAAIFAAGVSMRWPPALSAAGLLIAVIAKEPILPVLALVGAAIMIARPAGERVWRAELVWLSAAGAAALALSAGFNIFRFGVPTNTFYLHDAVHPPLLDRASAFAAMIVSPNAGLLWFWPSAILLAVLAATAVSGTARRALLLLGLAFLVLVVGLASFWGPFGWEAWGPRLLLPWVPAFLIALAGIGGPALGSALERLGRRRAAAGLVLVIVALAVPQVAVFRAWHSAFDLFAPSASCSRHLPEIRYYRKVFGDTTGYYGCLRRQAWTHPPVLVHVSGRLDRVGASWAALAAACLIALGAQAGLVRAPMLRRARSST